MQLYSSNCDIDERNEYFWDISYIYFKLSTTYYIASDKWNKPKLLFIKQMYCLEPLKQQ